MSRGGQRPVIVVGVAGSGASLAALGWAAAEARRRGAALRVVQAREPHPMRALYAGHRGQSQDKSRSAAADQLAASVRACVGDFTGIPLDVQLVDGKAERVLAAASASADLLVLGSGSYSPVAQPDPLTVDRPVGPVIRACLTHARCPVVIITPTMAATGTLTEPDEDATPRLGSPARVPAGA